MVLDISEKRCGYHMHPSEHNDYNEALEAFLILFMNPKTLYIQKPNPKRWNTKSNVGPDG
jgi:ribosome biogenesis GTPase A